MTRTIGLALVKAMIGVILVANGKEGTYFTRPCGLLQMLIQPTNCNASILSSHVKTWDDPTLHNLNIHSPLKLPKTIYCSVRACLFYTNAMHWLGVSSYYIVFLNLKEIIQPNCVVYGHYKSLLGINILRKQDKLCCYSLTL